MREYIIEAIFERWSDGDFRPKDKAEIDDCIKSISNKFQVTKRKDKLFIETKVMSAICACEKTAFMEGFALCLDLFNGTLLQREIVAEGSSV